MKEDKIKKLISFFFEIGSLRKIVRSHRQTLLTEELSDNISSHSFRSTIIGYFLAKEVGADPDRVIKMCLLHDIEESRAGDQNWVHKAFVKVFEEEIREGQLKELPHNQELLELSKEYQERKTLEAKIAKDADLLDQVLLLREYEWGGNKEASRWLKRVGDSEQEKDMSTQIAKKMAKEIKRQEPSSWWKGIWTNKRR
jgi:putative hydrolase of HD superfamily